MKGLSINPKQDIQAIRTEYETLRRRAGKNIDTSDVLIWFVHPIWTLSVILYAAITTRDVWSTVVAGLMAVYIPGVIVSLIIAAFLDWVFGERIERYISERRTTRRWYQRYLYLGRYIEDCNEAEKLRLEEVAEATRKRLLPIRTEIQKLREQVKTCRATVTALDTFFSRKKKWYAEYREHERSVEKCLATVDGVERQSTLVKAKFSKVVEEVPSEFLSLSRAIDEVRRNGKSVLFRIARMKDWTPPIRAPRTTMAPVGGIPESRVTEPPTTNVPIAPNLVEPRQPAIEDYRGPVVPQAVVVVPPPPPQRRVLNRELKKIPFEDYVGRAAAQMRIGDLGEVVALHYEIRRVESETGLSAAGSVRRVSEDSDNLGYDIESFSQGQKVFIEVKSTSGPFWTDFYLSSNEQAVMEELGERYWLYRIFELSKTKGSAKLSIFRGRTQIEESFELEPVGFKFKEKGSNNGVLPFEDLE